MKIKENLTVYEAKEYAESNGNSSTMFYMSVFGAPCVAGRFLDAYLGTVQIPVLGSGFYTLRQLCNEFGEMNLRFDIIDEDEYNNMVKTNFVVIGKTEQDILEAW